MPLDITPWKQYIEDALVHGEGTHTFADIEQAIAAGTLQFWPGSHSAIVTEILTFPRQKVLHVFLAGGALPELEAMMLPLREWAREQGCTRATLIGRKGWERTFLARHDWQAKRVYLEVGL
jgi:hypothetical protein